MLTLMSLGAIDFGIIIDGAVIIVEFIAFQIVSKSSHLVGLSKKNVRKKLIKLHIRVLQNDEFCCFGQLIILIVFIPILSLSGVEGKMFKPMAMTFSFALLGAMLFCFTYVPRRRLPFLKPQEENPNSFSNRLINKLNSWYFTVIKWALQNTKKVLSGAVAILVIAVALFSTMGGEFIPQLDEEIS